MAGESYTRTIRDLDIGPKKCFVTFSEERLRCGCGHKRLEKISFARPYSRCTIRFERFVYRLSERMTVKDVSDVTDLDWKTVKDIDKHYIREQIKQLKDITPRRIGVDEIAYQKGHKYLTIVRDLDLNAVIWVGLKRKKETLDEFFNEIGVINQGIIELAVVDMWDPYIASIREYCPDADIVIDKFHIVKKANEALDTIRKREFANADENERKNMKRKRFIILKRGKNLSDEQKEKLTDLIGRNETLYKAYLLKEQISDIFDEYDVAVAAKRLEQWAKNVIEADIEPFKRLINTLKKYSYGIRNYFRYRVTNAGSEGFNTKINVIRRKAYGFWDLDYFILKIFQACGVMKVDASKNWR